MRAILTFFPKTIQEQLLQYRVDRFEEIIEEIRIRINRPIEIITNHEVHFIPYIVQKNDAEQLLNKLSNHSFYTLDEELRRGYITIEGGHRIGLAGKVILENGKVKAIRDVASFNIRIAKEQVGIAERWLPFLYRSDWKNTMIIGPPKSGKTTFLRDIARIISTGIPDKNIPALKVGIVDERSEIAGCVHGVPQLTFGLRIDILDACPKAEGMMMMIRSMSPDVLIVDEIGRKEDTEAILEAVHAGIKLIITTHGESREDLLKRPTLQPILDQHIFERYFELAKGGPPGRIKGIKNQYGKEIFSKVSV